ncbi:MAG: universal stress protein [Phaeodactylibacter sp.]|nr:universal stress protein [Phaeodactylibacter sp.]MCB9293272.1 universal stress protein [Lewinellaceae bacterium]
MKSILIPTDFGDTSRQIMHYALNYAEALNAKSTIVHTYQPTMSPRRPIIGEGTYRQQILKKLREFTTVYIRPPFKKVFFSALEGHPVHKLVEASKSGDFDLIIMGRSNKYEWLIHRFIESKTSRVCAKAHCPVLVVPRQAEFNNIHRVLLMQEAGDRNFSTGANETGLESPKNEMPVSASVFQFSFPQQKSGFWSNLMKRNKISYRKVKIEIQEYIRKNSVDLLVMRIEPRLYSRSSSAFHYKRRLLLELDIPILIVNPNVTQKEISSLIPGFNKRIIINPGQGPATTSYTPN